MMTAAAVLDILHALQVASVPAWVDGGWGVGALLGIQRRAHDDLDLVVDIEQLEVVVQTLAALGFELDNDGRPTRVSLHAADGRTVDLHLVSFTPEGDAIQQLQDGSTFCYRASGFAGRGRIGGQPVPCLDVAVQVECHLGYTPDAGDIADVQALADRFGIALPWPYFQSKPSG
ncbi:amino acid transporter [bacterium]|nr:amino acid transporter [bacterium]